MDIFMRLSIIRPNSTNLCASNKSLSKIWFYVIYYVDCQLDTILCLDLVFWYVVYGVCSTTNRRICELLILVSWNFCTVYKL